MGRKQGRTASSCAGRATLTERVMMMSKQHPFIQVWHFFGFYLFPPPRYIQVTPPATVSFFPSHVFANPNQHIVPCRYITRPFSKCPASRTCVFISISSSITAQKRHIALTSVPLSIRPSKTGHLQHLFPTKLCLCRHHLHRRLFLLHGFRPRHHRLLGRPQPGSESFGSLLQGLRCVGGGRYLVIVADSQPNDLQKQWKDIRHKYLQGAGDEE